LQRKHQYLVVGPEAGKRQQQQQQNSRRMYQYVEAGLDAGQLQNPLKKYQYQGVTEEDLAPMTHQMRPLNILPQMVKCHKE
jgi:hypothetical protein